MNGNLSKKPSNNRTTKWIKLTLLAIVLGLALLWIQSLLGLNELRELVKNLGPLGPLVVIVYIVASHVFAPLVGTPGIVLSLTFFGVDQTIVYLYFASLISASINFYISRVFGRRGIQRLVGSRTIKEIDEFAATMGMKLLVLSRLFGFAIFEVISYAAGLTNVSFQKYILITAFCHLIPTIVFFSVFRNGDSTSIINSLLFVGSLIVTGAIFSIFISRAVRKRKKIQNREE